MTLQGATLCTEVPTRSDEETRREQPACHNAARRSGEASQLVHVPRTRWTTPHDAAGEGDASVARTSGTYQSRKSGYRQEDVCGLRQLCELTSAYYDVGASDMATGHAEQAVHALERTTL